MRHPFLRTLAGSASDPYFNSVILLLHGDGTNGAQNNTFTDGSSNAFSVTRNGNTTQGSFNPFPRTLPYASGANGGSATFDGTDDYLSVADNANLRPGSGAFTIEAWIYRRASGVAHTIYAKGGASTGIVLQVTSGNILRFTHTTTNIDSTGTLAASTWNHVAVVREGTGTNQTKLYINGVQDGQGTVSTDFTQTEEVRIGTNRGGTEDFNGFISNVRFVKGTAVYTATFAVPTAPLTAISNTQLLLNCAGAAIFDNSMKSNVETVGNAQINTTIKKYGTGSIAFDGTGDYLDIPNYADFGFGTGDFTIEFWLYINSPGTFQIYDERVVGNEVVPVLYLASGQIRYYVTADRITGATLSASTWYHIAISRSGSSTKLFVDGTQSGSTYTDNNNYINLAPYVGVYKPLGIVYLNGYIDDLRITKGVARYTSNFTAPTAAFPDL